MFHFVALDIGGGLSVQSSSPHFPRTIQASSNVKVDLPLCSGLPTSRSPPSAEDGSEKGRT